MKSKLLINQETKNFRKLLDLVKQIADLIPRYRINISQLSDTEILEKFLEGFKAAFFLKRKIAILSEKNVYEGIAARLHFSDLNFQW